MKKKVLVFDDEAGVTARWRLSLERVGSFDAEFEVEAPGKEEFRGALEGLERRQRAARSHEISWEEANLLDGVDILFVDYDLLTLYGEKFEVGENVAYLARCYSRCRLIIAVNQYGQNEFDLTLRGHPESFADLNLGSEQIQNPALWDSSWKPDDSDVFRAWHWPHLPSALRAFEGRRKELCEESGILDEPILSHLGFSDDAIQVLPRRAVEFIQGDESLERTTFRDFVLKSGSGLHLKDKGDDVAIAQVAAARIGKWLELLVLAGQDVLVDAPHLVTRFPGLLDRDRIENRETWNATVDLLEPGITRRSIEQFEFQRKDWLSRVAWFGRKIGDSHLRDELDPWGLQLPGFVFCEDRSAFRSRDSAREFVADVPSAFVRRFVGEPPVKGVRYQPSVRFSL